jgi:hypothetical protein
MPESTKKFADAVLKGRMKLDKYEKQSAYEEKYQPE